MLAITGILTAAVAAAAIEVPSLLKAKQKKELFIFSILLLFGVAIAITLNVNDSLPNPMDGIYYLIQWISQSIGLF